MWKLLYPGNLLNKNTAIGGLVVVILLILVQYKRLDTEYKTAKLVYSNPATKEIVREVRVQGPVRIVYRTIKEPSGVERTETITEQQPVTAITETAHWSEPVPVSVALAPIRTNRWLLTFGVNRLTPDFDGKAVLAGYGWNNRFDLQAGIINKEGTSPWLMGTMRF